MSNALFDSITRIARHEAQARAAAGVAVVTDTQSTAGANNDYTVSVKMRDSALVLNNVPVASNLLGTVALPEPGDLVVVVFTDGDFNAPIVVGRLHNPERNPPTHETDQLVMSFPAGSDQPTTHLCVGRGSSANIQLRLGDRLELQLDDQTATLTVGDMTLTLTDKSGGAAKLDAGGSIIELKNGGDITVSSKNKLILEGTEVEIKGRAKVAIEGAIVEVN